MSTHPSGGVLSGLFLLLARLALATIFIVHGVQKLMAGVPATAAGFGQQGVPYPEITAWSAIGIEIVGGALLVLGLATRVVGVLFVVDMIGALVFVHLAHGFFIADGGYEFVLALAAGALALVGSGAGRLSLDAIFRRRRYERRTAKSGVTSADLPTPTPRHADDSAWASDRTGH